jgi:hypothetical protein
MTLQLLRSEFPYISEKFDFLFLSLHQQLFSVQEYQYTVHCSNNSNNISSNAPRQQTRAESTRRTCSNSGTGTNHNKNIFFTSSYIQRQQKLQPLLS